MRKLLRYGAAGAAGGFTFAIAVCAVGVILCHVEEKRLWEMVSE